MVRYQYHIMPLKIEVMSWTNQIKSNQKKETQKIIIMRISYPVELLFCVMENGDVADVGFSEDNNTFSHDLILF